MDEPGLDNHFSTEGPILSTLPTRDAGRSSNRDVLVPSCHVLHALPLLEQTLSFCGRRFAVFRVNLVEGVRDGRQGVAAVQGHTDEFVVDAGAFPSGRVAVSEGPLCRRPRARLAS